MQYIMLNAMDINSLHSMGENLAALDTEIEGAVAVGQEQKLARLRDKKEKLAARRQAVQAAAPVTHRLKKWAEIQKIHAALHHIHVIEDKGRWGLIAALVLWRWVLLLMRCVVGQRTSFDFLLCRAGP